MTDQRMLAEIREDVKKIIVLLSSHTIEIKQIQGYKKTIDSLVAWRNRFKGAIVALSVTTTFVGVLIGIAVKIYF